jgi:mannose-6-phosphate isomerase
MTAAAETPFRLETLYQPRIWGGDRLGAGAEPIGEAWCVYEGNRISSGPMSGMTLQEASAKLGERLLGSNPLARTGRRFPILTKLIDARNWLSVQLHPDDEQAEMLEGSGQFGKTEAWHLLETEPGAELIVGLRDGTGPERFEQAVRAGRTLDAIARRPARAGDTWFIPAGTVHALGPGIFLYEIQQSSDITYRVYDWDRPAGAGRELHIEQAISCVRAGAGANTPSLRLVSGRAVTLAHCPYFKLERLWLPDGEITMRTDGTSFHALTVIDGGLSVATSEGDVHLDRFETAIIPAAAGSYRIAANPGGTVMLASVPSEGF